MNEEAIFAKAIEIVAGEERDAFITQACGDDQTLRGGVEALLRSHEQASQFLEVPALESSQTSQATNPVSKLERPQQSLRALREWTVPAAPRSGRMSRSREHLRWPGSLCRLQRVSRTSRCLPMVAHR